MMDWVIGSLMIEMFEGVAHIKGGCEWCRSDTRGITVSVGMVYMVLYHE
jgi:hypothetical protein